MAKITEQDIITFLESKIEGLQKELRKSQAAIDAIKGSDGLDQVKLKKKENKIIKAAKSQSVKEKKNQKTIRKGAIANKAKPASVVRQQNQIKKLQDKINQALSQGPAYREAIVSTIHSGEPETDLKKLDKAVANKLSSMLKSKMVQGEKEGVKYKYSLQQN